MEALGLGLSSFTALRSAHQQQSLKLLSSTHVFTSSRLPTYKFRVHQKFQSVIRMQVVEEEYEVKQAKDMAAARKRWEAMIRDGKVKILTPREAGYAIQLSNTKLLDVRPSTERTKAWVKGSTWIPIFDVDNSFDAGTVSRKLTNFVMGGWWSGVPALSYEKNFLSKVEEKFSKDTDVIVACQKGLRIKYYSRGHLDRSLAACELLYNAGYQNIFWIQGGLEAAEEEDLEREGPQPFKFAGIGGVSEFLGWTDQQRAQAAKEGLGYRLVFTARLFGVILAADALYIGAQQVGRYIQDLKLQ